jgi:predicted TIM-barrel fold metal-dependent hydrolase
MRIVDPHVHIWDLSTGLYPGLEKPSTGFVGNNAAIARSYLLPELIAEAAGTADIELAGIVHVEAFPTDRIAETRYLQELADGPGHGFPQGLVVNADLAADDAEAQLEAQCAFANTRGVRQVVNQHADPLYSYGVPDNLNNPAWRANFKLLKRFGLSFDLQLYPHQIRDALVVIDANPDVQVIVNHAAMPCDRTPEGFAHWQSGIADLARRTNIAVKISGLGMFDHAWTVDTIRPYVHSILSCFDVSRVMFASNFPVDKLFSTYADLWHSFFALTADLTSTETGQLVAGNAERLYRLQPP